MKTKIQITSTDIKKGFPNVVDMCPIALAVRRKMKAHNVSVGGHVNFSIKRNNFRAKLPKKAVNFIIRFDDGQKVKPFSFIMTVLEA